MDDKKKFEEQFKSEDELEEAQADFVRIYAVGVVDDEVDDPLDYAVAEMIDGFEWDIEPTEETLKIWEDELREDIDNRIPFERVRLDLEEKANTFLADRQKGKSVVSIARKLKATPGALLETVERYGDSTLKEHTPTTLEALREDEALKAHKSRTKIRCALTKRIETELKSRDFSDVRTDKLVEILVKLTELSRSDEPPILSLEGRFHRF